MAAIMFTDMVGYTALGQKNESLSLALVEEHRRLLRPIFSRHGGREVKTIGDAFFVEFQNALEAIRCAYDVQRATKEFNVSFAEDARLHLRVGVHLGDVVESAGDLSGDAVNVASRVESFAEDGGVCITRQVYDQVYNKFELRLQSLGLKALKNVSMPLEIFKVVLPWSEEEPMAPQTDKRRIAVLPFANMSPDPADEFFADGLTEEMITELSSISGLGVIARTSVMRYKGGDKSIKEIGRELGVQALLEGSVRKAGNKLRIVAQLINTKDEEHMWASKYDREFNDVFEVQSEIAQNIARALTLKLMPQGESLPPSENLEAFTLCLKARSFWNKRTKGGIDQGILLFGEALKADPGSARAYVGLADCYHVAAHWRYMDFDAAEGEALKYARKALELAPDFAEAHATLGSILLLQRSDYVSAESELKRAVSLNPNYAPAHQWYADLLMELGRTEEAGEEVARASELDPFSPVIGLQLVWFSYYTGRVAEAEAKATRLIGAEPGLASAYSARAYLRAQRGDKAGAKLDLEMHYNLTDDECAFKVYSATVEALAGGASSRMLIEQALPLVESSQNPSSASPCWFYAATGDKDGFFKWADWSVRHRAIQSKSLRYDPILLRMQDDSRYRDLFEKMNLQFRP